MAIPEAAVIGGGFVGLKTAIYLRENGYKDVTLIEAGSDLASRASKYNQFRVHRGYHYPRDTDTALESADSYEKFIHDYAEAIVPGTKSYYAITKDSLTSADYFYEFNEYLGNPISDVTSLSKDHFNMNLISRIFKVDEQFFDPEIVKKILLKKAKDLNIRIMRNAVVDTVKARKEAGEMSLKGWQNDSYFMIRPGLVINCTYSGINNIKGDVYDWSNQLTYQIAEVAKVKTINDFNQKAFTVVDGPYFSLTPRREVNYHSLSHVIHTPHVEQDTLPDLKTFDRKSRFNDMLKDASLYMPRLKHTEYVDSHFEIKVLPKEKADTSGRPVTIKQHGDRCFSILGGKIDTISHALDLSLSKYINL